MSERKTRSPIKNLPVRMPGQSIREALGELLDEKALPAFIRNANSNPLSGEDVALIVFHLKRYVISQNQ